MKDFQEICEQIEAEYSRYQETGRWNEEAVYLLLSDYVHGRVETIVRMNGWTDEAAVEDVVADTCLEAMTKGREQYRLKVKPEGSRYACYCLGIARNKACDYVKRRSRELLSGGLGDKELINPPESGARPEAPEERLLRLEYMLELADMTRRALLCIVNWKDKAYRTVGNCYTLVLYALRHQNSRELSSPSWAYEQLSGRTVGESADSFTDEINSRLNGWRLRWGPDFLDSLEKEEFGCMICNLVFDRYFKVKDLENWSRRFRQKLKAELLAGEAMPWKDI